MPLKGDGGRKSDENVRVVLKVRPLIPHEKVQGCSKIIEYPQPCQLVIGNDRAFTYDHVYNEAVPQDTVYGEIVDPLVNSFLEGYNATIFAYGQTGSGKTYTMGTASNKDVPPAQLGIVPRMVKQIFDFIQEREKEEDNRQYHLRVAFLEIHNEEIVDLLDPDRGHKVPQIRETPEGEIVVHNVFEEEVATEEEMLGCLEKGSLHRATGATLMNATSSRSHAIFTVFLDQVAFQTNVSTAEADVTDQRSSKFHFVDLAGSERLKRTGAVGQRMKEGISINSGLLALGNVISALGDPTRKGGHVPFRDSKITRLLQDSLGGNSKTVMIACVSPADVNFEETLNTLKYANRAKNIKNKAVINRDPNAMKIEQLMGRIKELETALIGGGGSLSALGNHSAFQADAEEMGFLQEQNVQYEAEIQRLMSNLKEARLQMAKLGDQLQASNRERDEMKMKVKRAIELANGGDTLGLEDDLNVSDLDVLGGNAHTIQQMQSQINSLRMDLRVARDDNNTLRQMVTEEMDLPMSASMLAAPTPTHANSKVRAFDDSLALDMQRRSQRKLEFTPRRNSQSTTMSLSGVGDLHVPGDDVDDNDVDESVLSDEDASVVELTDDQQEAATYRTLAGVKNREYEFAVGKLEERQAQLQTDIQQKEVLMKQLLKTRETANAMRRHYELKIHEMEEEVKLVAKERERALSVASPKAADKEQTKRVVKEYEERLQRLQMELTRMREKLTDTQRLQAAKARDEALITRLKNEIEIQRKEKVKLARKVREEHEKHRLWMKQNSNRIKKLEMETARQRTKAAKATAKLNKQELVLKRRNEEKERLQRMLEKTKNEMQASKAILRNQSRLLNARQQNLNVMAPNGRERARSRSAFVARHMDAGEGGMLSVRSRRGGGRRVAVASGEKLDDLKKGFQTEISTAVNKLSKIQRYRRLLKKRESAEKSLEDVNARLDDRLSAAERELYKDRQEAFETQLRFLNRELVNAKVDMSRGGDANVQKSVFSRHRISRLDHGRALILHLMEQVVNLKLQEHNKEQTVQDMQEKVNALEGELKQVTRQSLMLQRTPGAKNMLKEMDEVEKEMIQRRKLTQEVSKGEEVRHFLRALNVEASPGHTNPSQNGWMDDGESDSSSNEGGPGNGGGGGGAASNSRQHRRSRSHLPPRNTTSTDDDGKPGGGRRRGMSAVAPNEGGGDGNETVNTSRKKRTNVFDRLTDKRQFTGMYKNIHSARPAKKELARSNTDSLPPFDTRVAKDSDRKPPQSSRPVERASTARSFASSKPKRSGGNVFDRLTDTKSYTGMYKATHRDDNNSGGGGGGGSNDNSNNDDKDRPRSLSSLEADFDDMTENWKNNPVNKKKKKNKNRVLSAPVGTFDEFSSPNNQASVHLTPSTPQQVTSPIDKATALSAVKKLDNLFNKFKKTKEKKSTPSPSPPPPLPVGGVAEGAEGEGVPVVGGNDYDAILGAETGDTPGGPGYFPGDVAEGDEPNEVLSALALVVDNNDKD